MPQANANTLTAEARTKAGTAEARRLRRNGRLPAVVYGHKEANEDVSISRDDFGRVVRQNQRIVDLVTKGGNPQKCLVRDVQWDVLGKDVVHVDFERVSADERIHLTIPIKLKGNAPGAGSGSVLSHHLHEVEIECPASAIPDAIVVNISGLQLGQAIHVKELQLPEGVKALSDADEVVVAIVQQQLQPVEVVAPIEGGAAEPEVITARKPAEGEGEEEPAAKKK
jgi:large subunit ribosomal protein L25